MVTSYDGETFITTTINNSIYFNVPNSPYWFSGDCAESYPCQHGFYKQKENGSFEKYFTGSVQFACTLEREGYMIPRHFVGYLKMND